MIGSGNPQEGELRPQLLDRFGLSVNVSTILDVDIRTQMVLDRIAYDKDPDAFCEGAEEEQQALRNRLDAARARLATVPAFYYVMLFTKFAYLPLFSFSCVSYRVLVIHQPSVTIITTGDSSR